MYAIFGITVWECACDPMTLHDGYQVLIFVTSGPFSEVFMKVTWGYEIEIELGTVLTCCNYSVMSSVTAGHDLSKARMNYAKMAVPPRFQSRDSV